MTPAQRVIKKLGGLTEAASLLNRHEVSIRKWNYPKERGGCDGRVPGRLQSVILKISKEKKLGIQPADFFEVEEVRPSGSPKNANAEFSSIDAPVSEAS